MSLIFNPTSNVPFYTGSINVVLNAHSDETLGSVSGLSSTPAHIVSNVLFEEGVIVQSGMVYDFNVTQLIANGFNYRLRVTGDEYWPGPSSVTIKVNYIWSSL
jgi:hypothetical protein